jgi:hypothetical protein
MSTLIIGRIHVYVDSKTLSTKPNGWGRFLHMRISTNIMDKPPLKHPSPLMQEIFLQAFH